VTGTCVVPEPAFTLRAGDLVRIEVGGIGLLADPVTEGSETGHAAAAAEWIRFKAYDRVAALADRLRLDRLAGTRIPS
jgi:2-dehydro-3-deoxy-D-arabinonate dehydratase